MSKSFFVDKTFKEVFPFKKRCIEKEFENCIFEKLDFTGLDFTRTIFLNCEFKKCNFSNSKLKNCSFKAVQFSECKFVGILFSEIDTFLINWNFNKCKIELCMFEYIDIERSTFVDCKVLDCKFVKANLKASDFSETDFYKSLFDSCNLESCDFRGSQNYFFDITKNSVKKAKFSKPEVIELLKGFEIDIE